MNRQQQSDAVEVYIREILRFDRFYAQRLQREAKALLTNEVTMAEAAIFRELMTGPGTAAWLSWRLDMDPGYASRTLALMEMKRYVDMSTPGDDRRQRPATLTPLGVACARTLEEFQGGRARRSSRSSRPATSNNSSIR